MQCHRCGRDTWHARISNADAAEITFSDGVDGIDIARVPTAVLWRDLLLVAAYRCTDCHHARIDLDLCPYGCAARLR